MKSIRKWFCKPKRSDRQLLAQFYFANEELNEVSQELDSFDGRQDPERCTALVNHLRRCQDKVLSIVEQIMIVAIPTGRANRDYRAKFPEDVLLDSLPGQLWFGAECLGAGSTIMNREIESAALRPLARGLTKTLDTMRMILKEQCYDNLNEYSDKVKVILKRFDETFAEFELSYVSTMVPVKSSREYDTQQDVIVLFCETLNRALTEKLLTQDQVDDYDPGLMFTIPRLAIVSGLVVFPDGPLNMGKDTGDISELFRPFQALLSKIKELLQTLAEGELHLLEKALCNSTGSWEDIEEQLKLMGRGSKARCNAAVQTDPTDFLEKGAEGGCSGELMFGMSPIEEEVAQKLEREVSILGSSPNQNMDQSQVETEVPSADATEDLVDDGIESVSSGIVEDNVDNEFRSPLQIQSPGELSNGDIFDDVDSHTLGMSPVEQKVEYKISPKHKSLALKRSLLDRVTGQDSMSHVYGMSPMEAGDKDFARDSLFLGASPLDSPIIDSFEASQARSDVLGVSPVDSVPTIPCRVTSEMDVDKEALCQNSVEDDHKSNCVGCTDQHSISSSSTNSSKQDAGLSETNNGINYIETIMEEIQSAENHRVSGNQGDDDSVQCEEDEKSMVIQMCQQLVDDIVQYAVQCSVFHSRHHGGRCLMTLKLSQYNISPTCSSCGMVVYTCTKGQHDKIYCEQCKQTKTNGLPSCESDATDSINKDIKKDSARDQDGLGDCEQDIANNITAPLSECAKVIEENRMRNESNYTKQRHSKCVCGKAATNGSVITSPKSPYDTGDLVEAQNNLSKLTDDDTQQNPEIIYSTGAIQKSGGVAMVTGEGTQWSCDGTTWESPIFGKGKPSAELSSAIPSGERLISPEDVSSTAASLDDSNLSQSDSYNSRHLTSYQVQSPSSSRVYPASAINRVTGSRGLRPEAALGPDEGAAGDSRRESNVSIAVCSSCGDELVDEEEIYQWESDDTDTDSTSSVSDNDEHEIAIAIQAAELSARQEARSHFTSSWDLVHRLFVCIAGVADQLQTNYASDLRNILKAVFEITANPHKPFDEPEMNSVQTDATTNSDVQSPSTEGRSEISSPDQNIDEHRPEIDNAYGIIPGAEEAPFDNEITVVMDLMGDQPKTEDLLQMDTDELNVTKLKLAPLEKGESLEMGSTVSDSSDHSQEEDLPADQMEPCDVGSKDADDEVFFLNLEDENNGQNDNEMLLNENKKVDSSRGNNADDVEQIKCQQQPSATAAVDEEHRKKEDPLKHQEEIVSDNQQLPVTNHQQQGADEQIELQQSISTSDVEPRDNDKAHQQVDKEEPELETKESGGDGDKTVDATPVVANEGGESVVAVTDERTLESSDSEAVVTEIKVPEGSDSVADTTEQETLEDSDSVVGVTEQKASEGVDSTTYITEERATEGSDSAAAITDQKIPEDSDSKTAVTDQKSPEGDKTLTVVMEQKAPEDGDSATAVMKQKDDKSLAVVQKALSDSDLATAVLDKKSPDGDKSVTIATDEKAPVKDESMVAVKPKKKRHRSGDLSRRPVLFEEPPLWVPDEECNQCTSCQSLFTMIRRKHHCRNCGKIFCSRCSANCVPLPKFGQEKPVRVCNRCYMFQVTPFQH